MFAIWILNNKPINLYPNCPIGRRFKKFKS